MGRLKQFDPDAAVAAAMDLFWRRGYGATTPAALTEEIGIGKGSLYHAFESKHALFAEALQRYADQRVAGLAAVLQRPGPVRARLQAALERLAAPENAHLRRRGCMAVNSTAELEEADPALAIARHTFERIEQLFQAAIEAGQASGEIGAERDAQELASLLLSTLLGMSVLGKATEGPARLRRAARALVHLI